MAVVPFSIKTKQNNKKQTLLLSFAELQYRCASSKAFKKDLTKLQFHLDLVGNADVQALNLLKCNLHFKKNVNCLILTVYTLKFEKHFSRRFFNCYINSATKNIIDYTIMVRIMVRKVFTQYSHLAISVRILRFNGVLSHS